MKLFRTHAEQLLLEKVRSLADQRNSWRCVFLNSEEQGERGVTYNSRSREYLVVNIINETLKDDDGHIYLCGNGDIFILFQGLMRPVLDRLTHYFSGLLGATGTNPHRIFDLSADWDSFLPFCAEKTAHPPADTIVTMEVAAVAPQKDFAKLDFTLFNIASAQRAKRRRPLALIVEDDVFTRRLIKVAMKSDCDIVEAGSGSEALQIYAMHAPDVVFLDIELPDMNGTLVLTKLLAFDKSTFAVMLSAHSMQKNITTALERGAQGFISKPFARDRLIHYLRILNAGLKAPARL